MMSNQLNIVALQCNSGSNLEANLHTLDQQLETISSDVDLIVLPEMVAYRRLSLKDSLVQEIIPGQICHFFSGHAKRLNSWIIIGSLCETISTSQKVYNTMVILDPQGNVKDTYRKLHLFDCNIPDNQLIESQYFKAGDSPKIVLINGFKIGLSICFDLRFPELFAYYSRNNVDIIVCPSSFTTKTGKYHWEPLLRARAIETQAYVIAPNQYGLGGNNVMTYGHSMIIDPWGDILEKGPESDKMILRNTLSKERIKSIRSQLLLKSNVII